MIVPLPVLPAKRRVLRASVSALQTFTECERLYSLDRLFETPSSEAQEHGTRVHDAIAAHLLGTGDLVPPDLVRYVDAVQDLMEKWRAKPVLVEEWINTLCGMPFSGRVDLVADTPHGRTILDWKTCSTTLWAKTAAEARRSLQLQAYCLALSCTRAGFVYLPQSAEPVEVIVEFKADELRTAWKRIESLRETLHRRWESTGLATGLDAHGNLKLLSAAGHPVDLSEFALSSSDFRWCTPKCRQYSRCLGKEAK